MHNGNPGGKPSRRNDLLIASAVAIGCAFISEAIPISRTAALVLVGVAIVLAGLGSGLPRSWIEQLFHFLGRAASALIGYGNRSNVARTCSEVAEALEALLLEVVGSWDEMGALAKHRANRQLIARYKLEYRRNVRDAIAQAEMRAAVSVPPEIRRYAEHPRNVNNLIWLRDWLRRIGQECQPA